MLNKKMLKNCIVAAKHLNMKFIAVKISFDGCEKSEIIINDYSNFDYKLAYYESAYDDNLCLNHNNEIKITGFTYGNSFEEIQKDLLGE